MSFTQSLSQFVLACARLPLKSLSLVTCFVLVFFAGAASAQQYGSLTACAGMSLGTPTTSGTIGGSLNGFVPFPSSNAWNTNIASAPLDPNSSTLAAAFPVADLHPGFGQAVNGYGIPDNGIPYIVVDSTITPSIPITLWNTAEYGGENDVVVAPYPANAPIEGATSNCQYWPQSPSGDSHVLVLDRAQCWLYETYGTTGCNGQYEAETETIWDMANGESRPWGWISADAAGLSIFSGLVRYDEAISGSINHALRFTMEDTEGDSNDGYFVLPASHAASSNTTANLLPMGTRLRLKATTPISSFSTLNQTILTAMMNYGLILADNGNNFYVQGSPDARWSDNDLGNWHSGSSPITQADFEVIQMTPEYPGMDSASAYTDYPRSVPVINSFTATDNNSNPLTDVQPGDTVTFDYSVTGDSYDYIDNIGPARLSSGSGSVTITPTQTQEFTLYSTNATGQAKSTIEITMPSSVVAPPIFTPPPQVAGAFTGKLSVSISTPTSPSATIYYTLVNGATGTTPTTNSNKYNGTSITISLNNGHPAETVEAIAVVSGYSEPSAASSATYIYGTATATPTFSPGKGTYSGAQTVTISDKTVGTDSNPATIYYTTNGMTPTTASAIYSGPITVAVTQTVKAIGAATGYSTSAVGAATYTMAAVATPTFSPVAGSYNTGTQTITISDTNPGATIYYTITAGTTGMAPTTASTVYSGPIAVSASSVVEALAVAYGYSNSAVASAKYTLTIATPTFSPAGGNYTGAQSVTISEATPGPSIYFTTDGTTPAFPITGTTQLYTGPITAAVTQTIKAIGAATGFTTSAVGTVTYTLTKVATPSFSPVAGNYIGPQTITISDTNPGATIYYTITAGATGTTPTTASAVYSGPITVSATSVVEALAVAYGYTNSAVASAKYTLTIATPTFSPVAGNYTGAQTVTISDTTPGATIYYTVKAGATGTAPTTASTVYTGPITVSGSSVVEALAAETGYTNSAVASAKYTLTIATPTFSPVAGTYTGAQSVTISDTTPGAVIYYTVTAGTTGTAPTTASTVYTGPITVSGSSVVEALAAETGYTNSAVASAKYTLDVVTPTFSPAAGTYATAQSVTISDTTPSSTIYYTTNGTAPTTSSTVYSSAINVSASETVEAIATATGYGTSAVGTAAYTIQAATPTFSPVAGTYATAQSVTISDSTPSSTIYYTTDGSTPTTGSTVYSSALNVSTSETVNAMATATGYGTSPLGSAAYTIQAATPTFSPAAGTYTGAQTVTISDTTPSSTIYYTTNGTAPTTGSTVYAGAITVSASETVSAIAAAPGYGASPVGSAAYTIVAATPTFNPGTGTYSGTQTVTINTTTPSATIYYTTDGSTPTYPVTGTTQLYSAPITVSASQTVNAIATATGVTNSAVGSAVYTLVATSPTFSFGSGAYTTALILTISDITPGATIYYTNDGSTPTYPVTGTTQLYFKPFTVYGSATATTVNAIAVETGYTTSAVASATYNIPVVQPVLTTPVQSSTLTSTSVNFAWTPGTMGTLYELFVGTMGMGTSNLYNSGATGATSATVTVPATAMPVYARLYWLVDGTTWSYADYTFTASGTPTPAVIQAPTPGTQLGGTSETFSWTTGVAATDYELFVGTMGVGTSNLYNSGATGATSATVSDLPSNGQTVYVRLYSLIAGAWQYNSYTYTASGSPIAASLTTPTPGTQLSGTSVTFTWNPGNIATNFELFVGTMGMGTSNLYNSGDTGATSATVSNLPSNGEKVYVRLYSLINGAWQYTDYTYVGSGSPIAASLTTPTPNTTTPLSGYTVTFIWNPGNIATNFALFVGTMGMGTSNLYNSGDTGATSATVTDLPTNGSKVYVRLYSLINGGWQYTDYSYVAF